MMLKFHSGFILAPWLLGFALVLTSRSSHAAEPLVQFLAQGSIPGTSRDLSGLTGTLETQTPANQLGGFSAIEHVGELNRFIVLSDRGPGDGAASFANRFHEVELQIDADQHRIDVNLLKTVLLKSADGTSLSGSLTALEEPAKADGLQALDSEGIRLIDSKWLAISEEYGPSISQFDLLGRRVRQWSLPDGFALSRNPHLPEARGTFPNRGLEGLTLSTDGSMLVAAMQGPLIQDGQVEGEKCLGVNTRLLTLSLIGQPTKQWVYRLTDESAGISEILAVADDRWLVLERDSKAGNEARIKRIYLIETGEATDVSQLASLGRRELPAGVQPVRKKLLIDLLDDRWGLGGANAAEKPEGMAWGRNLPDGRRLLIVCVDNDFETDRKSEFYAFAIQF